MLLRILFLLLICLGCSTTTFALELSTLEIYLSVDQGGQYSETVTLTNSSDEVQHIRLYVGDWNREEYGLNCFFPPNTIDRSLASWIHLVSPSFALLPAETHTITIYVTIPPSTEAELDGTYWGMVFAEIESPNPEIAATGVMSTVRYGVKVYATIQGTENNVGVVQSVQIEQIEDSLLVTVEYENAGNIFQDVALQCDVVDRSGTVCRSIVLEPCPLLPSSVRTLEIPLDPLPPGLYQAVVQADYGGDHLVGGVRAFRVR